MQEPTQSVKHYCPKFSPSANPIWVTGGLCRVCGADLTDKHLNDAAENGDDGEGDQ